MIYYLVKKEFSNSLRSLLATWGKDLKPWLRVVPYETLFRAPYLRQGSYIFSDLERLSAAEAELAAQVWQTLRDTWGETIRLCNHPTRALNRCELLRRLFEKGINDYNAYPLESGELPRQYPVFIRNSDDHGGARSGLLATPAELAAEMARIDAQGQSRRNKLIVEYCHTADAHAVFRKYSCFLVNGSVIPRHICFGREWMLKIQSYGRDFSVQDLLAEELRFAGSNPHEKQVREIFALAHIDYGRIDYSLKDGRVQAWEINTNPWIVSFVSSSTAQRLPVHETFLKSFSLALRSMDSGQKAGKVKNSARRILNSRRSARFMTYWGQSFLYALPLSLPAKARMYDRWQALKKRFFPGRYVDDLVAGLRP